MKIYDFDIKKGIYNFEFDDLTTEKHAHPVVEFISATSGTFTLRAKGRTYENLEFAIIDQNTEHKVVAKSCSVSILLVESYNSQLSDFFDRKGILLKNGVFIRNVHEKREELFSEAYHLAVSKDLKTPADKRINTSIKFIEENELEYKDLLSKLTSQALLSDSRLSHLFKEHIGISIKKYLVWNKLRQAIHLYLNKGTSLTDVSLQSGFFDQAHFSNSFKNILGISPSKAYNSRILQSQNNREF
ncbi:AraC family transcriptional regulator [Croceitalea sp. MTPC5]|uniref:helix-turn-helix domain-containing protein n=1 Tax=Croceitalea sp. MTPC5 TaxID=3056565 RepID=UPI002B39CA5B|nr:AraC family transcriptional regulator [Croceitalea sp. MTPC5]